MPALAFPDACPLCGLELDVGGERCLPSCPMSAGCILIRCPRCLYSLPNERVGLAGRLRRFFHRRRRR